DLVHRAGPVALEVERHIRKPQLLEPMYQRTPELAVQDARELGLSDLDPRRRRVVMPDAEIPEAGVPEKRLRSVDPSKGFLRDREPVGKARREAGERSFFPCREAQLSGDRPDLGFAEIRFQERRADVLFFLRPHAWAEVPDVVGNRAVDDEGN